MMKPFSASHLNAAKRGFRGGEKAFARKLFLSFKGE